MKYIIIYINSRQKIIAPTKYLNLTLSSNIAIKNNICFNKIMLICKKKLLIGKPFIKNCYIIAKIITSYKSKKMLILRNKPKKNYLKRRGHRTIYYRLYVYN